MSGLTFILLGVNDEQRRGHVAKWMGQVGEAWLTTDHSPDQGSELAGDDAAAPKVSPVASYGVVTAIDHLGAVVDAMLSQKPIRHWAHFTTLRTTLLASARVRWMLGPEASMERKLRSVRIRHQNVDEQRKAINGFSGGLLDSAMERGRQKAVAALDAEDTALEAHALSLGAPQLTAPMDTVSMLRDLVDVNSWEGSAITQLWRTGSAAAHGYHWPDTSRANPGEFDEQSFNLALYGGFMFLKDALELYEKRAARHIP